MLREEKCRETNLRWGWRLNGQMVARGPATLISSLGGELNSSEGLAGVARAPRETDTRLGRMRIRGSHLDGLGLEVGVMGAGRRASFALVVVAMALLGDPGILQIVLRGPVDGRLGARVNVPVPLLVGRGSAVGIRAAIGGRRAPPKAWATELSGHVVDEGREKDADEKEGLRRTAGSGGRSLDLRGGGDSSGLETALFRALPDILAGRRQSRRTEQGGGWEKAKVR